MYTENQVIKVAKRENNLKRKYLVVNVLQGKHVPVMPSKALKMFDELTKIIKTAYATEKLLLIGFAETATAIGAAVATQLNCYYIQTTREIIEGVDYLFFSEEHSHASEQKLVKNDIDKVIGNVDRIIFIEDEVTTGNTIGNIISLLQKEYPSSNLKFSIGSIINGMESEVIKKFYEQHINLHYLIKTINSNYEELSDRYNGDGNYYPPNIENIRFEVTHTVYRGYMNARRVHNSKEYEKACNKLWRQFKEGHKASDERDILVLGTEEFMYPVLYVASMIEREGKEVHFHATTRSPIVVDSNPDYPLHDRYELRSLYDFERITFIYDLRKYEKVYVITDANNEQTEGLMSLLQALRISGNENIECIRWCQ